MIVLKCVAEANLVNPSIKFKPRAKYNIFYEGYENGNCVDANVWSVPPSLWFHSLASQSIDPEARQGGGPQESTQ